MIKRPSRRPEAIAKHSLTIAGHSTSVSLEEAFWQRLKDYAGQAGLTVPALVAEIDAGRGDSNLSSAIRVYLLERAGSGGREASSAEDRDALGGSARTEPS